MRRSVGRDRHGYADRPAISWRRTLAQKGERGERCQVLHSRRFAADPRPSRLRKTHVLVADTALALPECKTWHWAPVWTLPGPPRPDTGPLAKQRVGSPARP